MGILICRGDVLESDGEEIEPLWSVFIPIEPKPAARPRARLVQAKGKKPFASVYTEEKYRSYLERVKNFLLSAFPYEAPFDMELGILVCHYLPRPKSVKRVLPCVKPDLDNLDKALMDSGNGIVWRDDSLICLKTSGKEYAVDYKVGIYLEVFELTV